MRVRVRVRLRVRVRVRVVGGALLYPVVQHEAASSLGLVWHDVREPLDEGLLAVLPRHDPAEDEPLVRVDDVDHLLRV